MPSVSSPHAKGSVHEAVAPNAKDAETPTAGTKELYVSEPVSCDEVHCDSRHMRKTSIVEEA